MEKNRVELLETPGSWHKVVRYLRRVNARCLVVANSLFPILPRRSYRSCTHHSLTRRSPRSDISVAREINERITSKKRVDRNGVSGREREKLARTRKRSFINEIGTSSRRRRERFTEYSLKREILLARVRDAASNSEEKGDVRFLARRSSREKGFLACRARHHFWQPKNRLAIDRSCSIFGTRLTACCQIFFSPCPLFVNFRLNAGKRDPPPSLPSTFFKRSPPLPSVISTETSFQTRSSSDILSSLDLPTIFHIF